MTLIDKVRGLASANPLFTYQGPKIKEEVGNTMSCSYLPDDLNPQGCIMGAALTEMGATRKMLESIEGNGVIVIFDEPQWGEITEELDEDDSRWLQLVQRAQDVGLRWEVAVTYADQMELDEFGGNPPPYAWAKERGLT